MIRDLTISELGCHGYDITTPSPAGTFSHFHEQDITTAVIKQALCLSKGFTTVESSIKPLVSSTTTSAATGTIYTMVSGQVHAEEFRTAPLEQQQVPRSTVGRTHALVTPIYLSSDSSTPVSVVTYLDLTKRKFYP